MPVIQTIFQTLRRIHVVIWRTAYRFYCNAHAGTRVPSNTRIAPTAKLELETGGSVRFGSGCQLTNYSVISPYGGKVELADRVYLGHYSIIYGHGGVTIGEDTMIAAHVVIVAMSHGIDDPNTPIAKQPITKKGIKIGRDCWIGSGVKILDGVEIGDGCVIGAGAVVIENLPPRSIAVGMPAKMIRQRGLSKGASLVQR